MSAIFSAWEYSFDETPYLSRGHPRLLCIAARGARGRCRRARRYRRWWLGRTGGGAPSSGLAPQIDVTLIDRQPEFWSQPLSNRWLVGLAKSEWLRHDYRQAAQRFGYRFVNAEVRGIDRSRREVATAAGKYSYDWLLLAPGIREDFSAWYGVDRDSAAHTRQQFPSAFPAGREHLALKAKLESFRGGDLVITIPPMPYRCPPAPYERAGLIAWWLKTRNIKGRLVVLDPNLPVISFDRIFRDTYRDQITYLPQARIKSVDPFNRRIVTDFDTIDFSDAILMPPQQAADLVWNCGLIGKATDGSPSGWAACDPVTLNAVDDEHVFLVGDALDKVSPLFGQYPKTGQAGGLARPHRGGADRRPRPRHDRRPVVAGQHMPCHQPPGTEGTDAHRIQLPFPWGWCHPADRPPAARPAGR